MVTFHNISVVLVSVGSIALVASADDGDPKEKVFKAKEAYNAEILKLRAEMIAVFEKQEDKARKDGNKKFLDEIKFNRKLFDDEEEWPTDTPANLNKRLKQAKADVDAAMVSAIKECIKAKKDDDAAAVEKELIDFRREVLWPALDLAKAKFDFKETFFQIPPTTFVTTRKSYSGPVEITLVARTEAENIRLHAYRGACVIFNWEINPSELRVHRPDGDENGVGCSLGTAKVNPLKPNTFYTLKWRITSEGMAVSVNDKAVFFEKKPYDLNKETKLTIETCKSRVDVKEYKVTRLFTAK